MKKRTLALIMALVLMLSVAIPGTLAVSLDASSTETTFSLDTEAPAPIAETPAEEAEPVEEAPAEEPAEEPVEEPADVEPIEEVGEEAEPEEEVDVKDVTVNEAATQSGEFAVSADNTVVDVNESVDEDDADEEEITLPECTCDGYNSVLAYDHALDCPLTISNLHNLSDEQMALLWQTLTVEQRNYLLENDRLKNNAFSAEQIEYVEKLEETQKKQDYCETITSVTDTAHGVTVSGVPEGVTLAVSEPEGYDDAIVALDITLQRGGARWQPYEDEDFQKYTDGYVALTLDLSGYELEDGTVVTLNHTHNGETNEYLYVVIDNKITFYTDRFSVYEVKEAKSKEGTKLSDTTISMTVGDEKHLYWQPETSDFSIKDVTGQSISSWKNFEVTDVSYTHCLWQVSDDSNTISYTVYDDGYVQSKPIYSWKAPWISVTAQSAGKVTLKLTAYCTVHYSYQTQGGYGQSYSPTQYGFKTITVEKEFTIQVSEKTGEKTGFHIEDKIAETGCLVPVWDGNTNNDTTGYTYTWTRSDEQTVRSEALEESVTVTTGTGDNAETTTYSNGVNVAKDKGGVDIKTDGTTTEPVVYTLTVRNADGEEVGEDSYKVLYGQRVLNPSFENPDLSKIDDGYDHLAVYNGYEGLYWKTTAPGSGDVLGADVELVATDNGTYSHGLQEAAEGNQFAELNAEAAGALYQDILTTSGAKFEWSFSHAARKETNEKMYIIISATANAQNIVSKDDINNLLSFIPEDANVPDAKNGEEGYCLTVTQTGENEKYNGTYYVWQHTSSVNDSPRWTGLSGTYTVPENQYLTRLFFVSAFGFTIGNFIDAVSAGETMSYKIEYYPEGSHETNKDETGNGSVYTTVQLENLDDYLNQGYIITSVKVNNKDYSGDIRNGLYITDYGTVEDQTENILVKIILRKKAITVTKKVTIDGWDELTDDERKKLVEDYEASFGLYKDNATTATATTTLTVSGVASDGTVSVMGEFTPSGGIQDSTYTVKETKAGEIEGYKLASTTYEYGEQTGNDNDTGISVTISNENLTAAVTVTNSYKEQEVTINYEAVGPDGATNFGSVTPTTETVKVKSGTAQGSTPTAGDGFKFVGWYTDEACTQPVETSWVTDNKIVPQKDKDGKNVAATYYAKFEYDITSLTITKTAANGTTFDSGETFVFTVTGEGLPNDGLKVVIQGTGSKTINGLKVGATYTVTEDTGWSWRYTPTYKVGENETNSITLTATASENVVKVTNTKSNNHWLDGSTAAVNEWKDGELQRTDSNANG